jgi:hypothetical protein
MEAGTRFCTACGRGQPQEDTAPLPTLLQVLRQATLGEYEILREIGQGGMATVFLAHEIALDRKVAIKVISPQFVHGAEMIERFKREARTAAGLNHPHIIPIYAVRTSHQIVFFVMKYIRGRSLDAVLREVGPLPFPMVRSILSDIGSALDYAHRKGVVHRDVKPGNIMLDEEGFGVITDFGIAKATEGDNLTQSGTTVGTPSYLSPEACSGEPAGPAADQYSLGIVGYEMVTGQLPFVADSSLGMMYAQVHTTPRPSDQLRKDCPADLRDTLTRMLEKAPGDRFPSLKEMVLSLSRQRGSSRARTENEAAEESVRTSIGLLAVPRGGRNSGATRGTPASPAPLSHARGAMGGLPRKRRVQIREVLTGLFLAALGAAVVLLILRDRLETPAAPPVDTLAGAVTAGTEARADSILNVTRGAAQYARERAIAQGIALPALATGDSLKALAESLALGGARDEASMLLQRAAFVYGTAENAVQTQIPLPVSPSPTPTKAPGKPAPTTPVIASPAGVTESPRTRQDPDWVAIQHFYEELERAVESRGVNEVRRLLPNLDASEEREWRGLFLDDNTRSIDATYQLLTLTRRGETVYAGVHEIVLVHRKDGRVVTKQDGNLQTELTFGPQGWRQIRSERSK